MRNQGKSIKQKTLLFTYVEKYFATFFESVKNELPIKVLLSITDPIVLKQTRFTEHETNIMKDLA